MYYLERVTNYPDYPNLYRVTKRDGERIVELLNVSHGWNVYDEAAIRDVTGNAYQLDDLRGAAVALVDHRLEKLRARLRGYKEKHGESMPRAIERAYRQTQRELKAQQGELEAVLRVVVRTLPG